MTKIARKQQSVQDTSDREIALTRLLDAPRERVWEAMTDPKQLEAWWGPNGFRNVTHEIAIKPSGIWPHTMIGPDGAEYPNVTEFGGRPRSLSSSGGRPSAPPPPAPSCRLTPSPPH